MRTSMNLPDALLEQVRERATTEHRTVTSLVEQALRELLDRRQDPPGPIEPLPTFGDPNGRFLVDLDDKEALWALLDEEDFGDLAPASERPQIP